jgi:Peptidase inhibitor family I36
MAGALFVCGNPAAAQGGPNDLQCVAGSGKVCLYRDGNYLQCVVRYSNSDSNYSNNGYDGPGECWLNGIDDDISSVKNRGNQFSTRHYQHNSYGGAYRTLAMGGNWPSVFINDQFSSHQWIA